MLLTEADSAYVQGRYDLADSLLAEYDRQDSLQVGHDQQFSLRRSRGNGGISAYRQYLGLTRKFVRDELSAQDFSLADSLCRVYDRKCTREKHARTLLFLGDVYKLSDYPSALNCYLQAESLGEQARSAVLQMWALRQIGDVYFEQRMLDDCKAYYRRYYQTAESCQDTLRMAHGSQRMGLVCTIENSIDSAIYYYKQAIELANKLPQKADILPVTRVNLADIYIQIEEYDEAERLMDRDSLYMFNWGYWHLCQGNIDSAGIYFTALLPVSNLRSKVDFLRELINIEKQRGNVAHEKDYQEQLIESMDSLNALSQEAATRKVHEQFSYNAMKRERDLLSRKNTVLSVIYAAMTAVLIVLTIIMPVTKKRIRERKERTRLKMRLKHHEAEAVVKKEAQNTDSQDGETTAKLAAFRDTNLYRFLHRQMVVNSDYKLTEDEWEQLAVAIDDTYNHFTSRLIAMHDFTSSELKMCYLMKAGVPNKDIAILLNKSASGVSHAKARLWKKMNVASENCGSLDVFISNL